MSYIMINNLTTPTDTAEYSLGQIGQTSDGKFYKYVQYSVAADSIPAVSGRVTYYEGATGYENNIVTSDISAGVGLGAGILVSEPTDNQYCWIQVKGPATLSIALTAGADGNALTAVGATDGTLDVSALVTDAIVAYASDASASKIICDFPF